jgi:tripartite-type tricarboxylate transporter receptor subunit TctC
MSLTVLSRRHWLHALALLTLPSHKALAQPVWPSRPVRLIVPYPSGGVSDQVARWLAEALAPSLGQPVMVENKPGASGTLGMDALAKSLPDGHTLALSAISPLTLHPHLGKTPYDPVQDITPIASVMSSPVLLLATPACQARDWAELLQLARQQPGAIRWSTSGSASLGHLMLEHVRLQTGVNFTHVPYKGGGQQITDALAGHVEILSVNAGPAVMAHLKQGRLRALAVGAPARLDSLPLVPTLEQAGLPIANLSSVFGLFAPARTPVGVVSKLNQEVNRVLQQADFKRRLQQADIVPTGGSSVTFVHHITQESQHNARVIQAARIQPD